MVCYMLLACVNSFNAASAGASDILQRVGQALLAVGFLSALLVGILAWVIKAEYADCVNGIAIRSGGNVQSDVEGLTGFWTAFVLMLLAVFHALFLLAKLAYH